MGCRLLPLGVPTPTTPAPLPGWQHPSSGLVRAKNPSGLEMVIDNTWADLPGYRSLAVEIHSAIPSSEDRDFAIEIK